MTFWDNVAIQELRRPVIKSDDLAELARYYETDKGRNLSDGSGHGYVECYERKFLPRRHNRLRILEVGVARGASLKVWASWFPRAEVHGIDINPNCRTLCAEFDNVIIHIGDASNFDFGGLKFDIVIDDGSHLAGDIIGTWENLQKFCHADTIYVIEDMHSTKDCPYVDAFRRWRGEGHTQKTWFDMHGFPRLRDFLGELSLKHHVEVFGEKIAFICNADFAVDDRTEISFSFGRNWIDFNRRMLPHRLGSAMDDLIDWFGADSIKGCNVIDVGSGSGLHSLSFLQCEAASVTSVDVDSSSVAATRSLQIAGVSDRWRVQAGSILDDEFVGKLGEFDIVYSWGVLHHTGAMWKAVKNCAGLCREGGLLMMAIYQGGHRYEDHLRLKQLFNRGSETDKQQLVRRELAVGCEADLDVLLESPEMQKDRGMNRVTDAVDWLGGLPYETARVSEVLAVLIPLGFVPLRVAESQQGGCSVYLFRKDSSCNALLARFRTSGVGEGFQCCHDFASWLQYELGRMDIEFRATQYEACLRFNELVEKNIWLEGHTKSGRSLLKFLMGWLRSACSRLMP